MAKFSSKNYLQRVGEWAAQQEVKKKGYSSEREAELQQKALGTKHTEYYQGMLSGYQAIGARIREESQAERRELGQVDLSTISPGMLSVIRRIREDRRRSGGVRYGGTLMSGSLGIGGSAGRAKTLLGQ